MVKTAMSCDREGKVCADGYGQLQVQSNVQRMLRGTTNHALDLTLAASVDSDICRLFSFHLYTGPVPTLYR